MLENGLRIIVPLVHVVERNGTTADPNESSDE